MKTNNYLTQIASHRGGTLLWGENTKRAFIETLKLNVELVEFDVHPSKDGVVVVHHDATLDRTTDMVGKVVDKTWEELARGTVNFSGGERMLTLEELCNMYQGSSIVLRLEIKPDADLIPYPGLVEKVLNILNQTNTRNQCVISSFSVDVLKEIRRLALDIETIWLVERKMSQLLGASLPLMAKEFGVSQIAVGANLITEEMKTQVESQNIKYGCFGAHNEFDIRRALMMKVCAFTTDRPDLAIRLRDEIQGGGA